MKTTVTLWIMGLLAITLFAIFVELVKSQFGQGWSLGLMAVTVGVVWGTILICKRSER